MSKRNKVLVGAGVAVALVVFVMISASAKREKGVEVRFEKVGRRDSCGRHGERQDPAEEEVDVSADITGRVTRIAVREGDYVQKGQFLLQIDRRFTKPTCRRAQAAMSSAEAGWVQARANRDRRNARSRAPRSCASRTRT